MNKQCFSLLQILFVTLPASFGHYPQIFAVTRKFLLLPANFCCCPQIFGVARKFLL
jgi:hypothetical protein